MRTITRLRQHSKARLLACILTLACSVPLAVQAQTDAIAVAVAHPGRDADRSDDDARKPAEVLELFGIEPGMRVLDLLAGGGYYTEILSRVVGSGGSVLFHNNQAYQSFLGDALEKRTAGERLPNVEVLNKEVADLDFENGELDAVVFILGFHDIYFRDDGWPEIDAEKLLATLYRGLRSGGRLGVVDHSAKNGAEPLDSGTLLHRIEEGFARRTIEAAGFVLEGESDTLRNADDDRSIQVFDPAIRRKTDRFVMLFKKP